MSAKNALIIREKPKKRLAFFFLMILITLLVTLSIFLSGYDYYLLKNLAKSKPKPKVTLMSKNTLLMHQKINSLQAQLEVFAEQIDSLQKQSKQPVIVNTNLLNQISSLQKEVTNLPLKKAFLWVPENNEKLSPSPWKKHLAHSLDEIKSVIIIRHHNTPIEPQRSPEERALLNERLQLTFQEAAWAVLQKNQAVYAWALEYIHTTAQQQFDLTRPETKLFLTTLNNLMQEKIIAQFHEEPSDSSSKEESPVSDEKTL